MKQQHLIKALSLSVCFFLLACESTKAPLGKLDLERVSFSQVPGWDRDNHQEALPAVQKSCKIILKASPSKQVGPHTRAKDWQPFCTAAVVSADRKGVLKALVQDYLEPHKVKSHADNDQGTFTGYYYPMLKGSYKKHGIYRYPLYKLPPKHLQKLSRRTIAKGGLSKRGLELVYVDSAIDAFFLEIQGSGLIQLENGDILRVGYAGQNGHPYYAIGKTIKERGGDGSSLQGIKTWLKNNPSQAQEIMNLNSSYVYFKKNNQEGAIGAQGVVLTPKRSIAVDTSYYNLGLPVWLDTKDPLKQTHPFQRLLVAQDTGGAIKGKIRGDVFFGSGSTAELMAGKMTSKGSFYVFLPKK